MKIKNNAALVIGGFECSPNEITKLMKVAPTQTWLRGEPVAANARNVQKQNGWQLMSQLDPTVTSMQQAIEDILDRLPDPSALKAVPSGSYLEMSCVVYSYDVRPFLELTSGVLSRMGVLGIDLDLDIYDLSSEGEA